MLMKLTPKHAETKVIEPAELQYESTRGWELIAFFEVETSGIEYTDQTCNGAHNSRSTCDHGHHYSHVIRTPHTVRAKSVRLIVGRSEGGALAERDDHIAELQQKAGNAARTIASLRDEAAEATEEINRLNKHIAELVDESGTQDERITKLRAAVDALEADLGKLRTHFGAKAITEALGGDR